MKLRVKEKNSKDSGMEYGIECHRNMDVEESGQSKSGIVWNVDLENVNENQLDWTSIQSRGFGHGGWKQKLYEHHPTKTEQLVRSRVEKWILSAYSVRRQNGRDKNSWETEWYDDRLDEQQRCGIWTYKEKILWQRRLASLEAWTCLKRQSTQVRERVILPAIDVFIFSREAIRVSDSDCMCVQTAVFRRLFVS